MKKILSMALALALVLGLAAPALAVGPTFSDVPESYWGYADIEAVAEAGLMNGTGNGAFSPEMKVSVAQFLTLLGRLVFPETTVGANDTWFGPYVSAAQEAGLLVGTQVDVAKPEAEISRYDMAVILRSAAKRLGVAEKAAQSGEVTDYGIIPNMYTDAVLAVYGMGLIKGDQAGNFNGSNTMMRAEVATVIMRLVKAKPEGISAYEAYVPQTEDTKTAHVSGHIFLNWGERVKLAGIPVGLFTADDRLVGQTVTDSSGNWSMDVTLDDKDTSLVFSDRTPITFYADILAPVDYNGVRYTRSFSSLRHIYPDSDSNTWGIRICRSEAYVCKTDDTPKDYEIYVPQSDDTVTFAEHGFVLRYEEGEGSSTPSGVKVGVFLSQNGSQPLLVAQTVTDADGGWSVDITMDEEDYNKYQGGPSFWASMLEPVTYNGKLYVGGKTNHSFSRLDWGDNWKEDWRDHWIDNSFEFSPRVIHLYGPKTFTVHGSISGRYPDDLVMPGIPVGFFLKDGRLLGQTTTDAEGKWSMEVTVDFEDYSYKESIYYTDILAPVEYNGVRYEEGSRNLNSLYWMDYSKGWRFIASSSEFGYLKHEH